MMNIFPLFFTVIFFLFILRFLSKTSLFHILLNCFRSLEDCFHVYQSFKVPQLNQNFQENLLYRKVFTYLNSLTSLEDSEFTNLFTGSKSNDITLNLDVNQTVHDTFLGARLTWNHQNGLSKTTLVLRLRKKDKRRILRPYLQHILSVADEIEENMKEIRLYMNLESQSQHNGRWRSIPFTHPATMETVVLDTEVKNKVKADLETFLKSKQYYHRLGRVWKRGYLLYGASGTGKSSFVAAMARFLCYDVYDIDLSRVSDDSDLKMLLLQTTSRSLILIEGLDKFLSEKSRAVSLSGIFNFMDGIISCCGEERLMVFTMNDKDQIDDQALMRAGRIDVQIHFPLCDFSTFKILASNYLGVKDHKLFVQVEEGFQNGPSLSPAQIGELMISNRTSPTRALKSVINALQRLNETGPGQPVDERVLSGEGSQTVKEFKKLYGLLRIGSRRKQGPLDLSVAQKEGSRHEA
ncbi:AAA-ATPase At2g46620-like [Pistacia vera]|uniref:AAA-ATPase At2g46620-like n=1 Tax=Pistacia vera TaxID=55513 RepID=UPI001262CDF8|nr:AAA-ATPase At2g46620-like [Pistacia vera]XP_031275468.1 AAA-ATPase At2g46620-like [Pistacia vera]